MKIYPVTVKVRDLFNGFTDDGEDGVFAFDGRLTIRPAYQRSFCYSEKQQAAVLDTVLKGYPLNTMYWAKTSNGENGVDDGDNILNGDDKWEVLDGQQRSLSILSYLKHGFSIDVGNGSYYENNLPQDLYDKIMDYDLHIYICEGTASEKLEWFRTVNIAGEKLTDQELLNASYTGTWLTDAKKHFSKTGCVAYNTANQYMNGSPIRQDYLEKALSWIADKNGVDIAEYMALHQHDEDANELWTYFQDVINWVKKIFPDYRSDMKGIDWGKLYNKYHENTYNTSHTADKCTELHQDEEVQNDKGIYEYILMTECNPPVPFAEKLLRLRAFTENDKRRKYEEQSGICPICGNHFEYEEMEGDHIIPWSQGGKTESDNLQMLCKNCNRHKSDD